MRPGRLPDGTATDEAATAARSDDGDPSWQSWLSQSLAERREKGVATDVHDTENVPSSLYKRVDPIMRAAKELEKTNPRVAYLCAYISFPFCFSFRYL